jgi:hypothetical protein
VNREQAERAIVTGSSIAALLFARQPAFEFRLRFAGDDADRLVALLRFMGHR